MYDNAKKTSGIIWDNDWPASRSEESRVPLPETSRGEVFAARRCQIDAFRIGENAAYFLCQAPGGSGKSALQCMLGADDLAKNPRQKQLILVPQQLIHKTFFGDGEEVIFDLDDQRLVWRVGRNLCVGKASKGPQLANFLLSVPGSVGPSLTAISTHQALVRVWGRLSEQEKRQAIRNCTFRLDEAHHVAGMYADEDLEGWEDCQKEGALSQATLLGEFCRFIIKHNDGSTKVHFTTATFFRGDRQAILGESVRQQFVTYTLPWEEHFPTLEIEELKFNYFDYDADPIPQVIEQIKAEKAERHLVILPSVNKKFRSPDTHQRLLDGLGDLFPAHKVLDLVERKHQKARKKLLLAHPEQFHVIVACRLFNEGTDWPICNRLHNTDAYERSLTLAIQRFFRPLRKHPQKKTVRINNYIPKFDLTVPAGDRREVLSNRFNAVMVGLLTNGELMPIRLPVARKGRGETQVALQEVFGAEGYRSLLGELVAGYERIEDKTNPEEIVALVDGLLGNYSRRAEVADNDLRTALTEQIIRVASIHRQRITKEHLEIPGLDAGAIKRSGFDKIWEKVTPQSVLFYGSDNIDAKMVRELVTLITKPLTLEEIHTGIKAYHDRTGERPTFKTGFIEELGMSSNAIEKRLRRDYLSTLAREVNSVLGHRNDQLLDDTRAIIRRYWEERGIRLTKRIGRLPELGITAIGLHTRLEKIGTTLAKEVDRVLGNDKLSLVQAQKVIRQYLDKGILLSKDYGPIPELGGIRGGALNQRLKRNFGTTLSRQVQEMGADSMRQAHFAKTRAR